MSDKDIQTGMVLVAISAFFLFSAIGLFDYYNFFDERVSAMLAYVLIASGVYLIHRK